MGAVTQTLLLDVWRMGGRQPSPSRAGALPVPAAPSLPSASLPSASLPFSGLGLGPFWPVPPALPLLCPGLMPWPLGLAAVPAWCPGPLAWLPFRPPWPCPGPLALPWPPLAQFFRALARVPWPCLLSSLYPPFTFLFVLSLVFFSLFPFLSSFLFPTLSAPRYLPGGGALVACASP